MQPDPSTTESLHLVSNPALREIASLGVKRKIKKGTVLFRQDEHGDTIAVIVQGRVEVYLSDSKGGRVVLAVRGAGECVGEMSLDAGQRRSASVACLEDCVLCVVTRKTLLETIARNPDVALFLISTLIQRARLATELVRNLSLMDVYERVAQLLQSLPAQSRPDGSRLIEERLSQAEIARRVGASRDMVNRIFKALAAGDYLRMEESRILLSGRELPSGF